MQIPKVAAAVSLFALMGAAAPQMYGSWPTPSKTVNAEGRFWDPLYNNGVWPKSLWRQHLGVDLKATTKDSVFSPVDGFIIFNNTQDKKITQAKAYIVIKETATGWEHVLGHINSTRSVCKVSSFPKGCSENARVYKGQSIVGYPMPKNEFGVHVHWGVNTRSVASALGFFSGPQWKAASGKEWGWGRAPYEAEMPMACSLGWVDPTKVNKCK